MNELYQQFENITLTGRLCYIFMCIEKYLVTLYPQKDWTPVAKRMWQWTNSEDLEIADDIYNQAIPECILEFDTYEETNSRAYDNNLKKEDYDEITACFEGITTGNSNDEICQILMIPSKFMSLCMYNSFFYVEKYTLEFLNCIIMILNRHSILLPDMTLISKFRFDRNHCHEIDKWGRCVNTEYLSIILK